MRLFLLIVLLSLAPGALAQEAPPLPPTPEPTSPPLPADPPLPPEVLEEEASGQGLIRSSTNGTVSSNTATNIQSGGNSVDNGSFAGAAGITTVIQNSGSNVLIQNATTVSVQFADPTP